MPYQTILYDRKDKIATITLNRPEKLNTIRAPMPDEVEQAVTEANADPEVRVIVLKGAGNPFVLATISRGQDGRVRRGCRVADNGTRGWTWL